MKDVLNTVSLVGALMMAVTPLVGFAAAAHAQDYQPQRIRVSDLDMSRSADQARFGRRADRAADRLCADEGDMNVQAACRSDVRDEARAAAASLSSSTTVADAR